MERILIYYSLEGHTRFIAQQAADLLGCDLYELQLEKQYPSKGFGKYFAAGRDSVFHFKRAFKQPLPDLGKYEVVLLATPVWAGSVSAPMYTYVKEARFPAKDLYLIACNSGGDVSKCFSTIKKIKTDGHVRGEISFLNPSSATFERELQRLKAFCKAVLSNESYQEGESDAR